MTWLYSGRVLLGSLRNSIRSTCLHKSSLSNFLSDLPPFDSIVVDWYSSSIFSSIFTAGITPAVRRGQNSISFALHSVFFPFLVRFWSHYHPKECKCWTTRSSYNLSFCSLTTVMMSTRPCRSSWMIQNLQCALFFSSPCMIATSPSLTPALRNYVQVFHHSLKSLILLYPAWPDTILEGAHVVRKLL